MAKKELSKKGSLIGAVGGILVGAAMLLFIVTIILNALKDNGGPDKDSTGWSELNETVDTLMSFLSIGVVLFGVLGITMIGATIIGYISGAFAG